MSQKDFTGWNGRKRKAEIYPPKEKGVMAPRKGEKPAGFKTKVDRYRQALKELAQYSESRREYWQYRREYEAKPERNPRLVPWNPDYAYSIRYQIKKLREMQKQYQREGVLGKVRQAAGL